MEKSNKGKTIVAFIILIFVVTGIGFGIWWYLAKYTQNFSYDSVTKWGKKSESDTEENTETTTDWKTYTDKISGVSFKYPSNWQLIETIGLGEGSGISPVNVIFAENKAGSEWNILNELEITIYYAGNNKTLPTIYSGIVKNFQGEASDVKFGSKIGKRYPAQPGMVSSLNPFIYYSGNDVLISYGWNDYEDNWEIRKDVSEEIVLKILSTFQFAK